MSPADSSISRTKSLVRVIIYPGRRDLGQTSEPEWSKRAKGERC
ncbi:Protein of unknown function [Pyronema omphalodes CBS 100304]|uniref:Uncharacterized protein n=1 Tax=Pyronema omphalodes (strain CBS 100304) TaxID=1076935 RepID=U4LTV2_PYROM|nr:Protein of unknown function [Pyronema omphalodes CBS 100304]